MSSALSDHAPAEAEALALQGVAVGDQLPADVDEFVRACASANPKDPPPAAASAAMTQEAKLSRCVAHGALARVRKAGGKTDEALEQFRRSLQAAREISDSPTLGSFARFQAADMQSEIGSILQAQKKSDEAMSAFRASSGLLEGLMKVDGRNVLWQDTHADVLEKVADLLDEEGKADEALADYRVELDARRRLVASNPKMPAYRISEATALHDIGGVLTKQGHLPEAAESFAAAVADERRLLELEPNEADHRYSLVFYQVDLADALNRQGKNDDARALYQEVAGYWRQQAAATPPDPDALDMLAHALDGMCAVIDRSAQALLKENKIPEALTHFREALVVSQEAVAIWRKRAATDPQNAYLQASLAHFLDAQSAVFERTAQALDKHGRTAEAAARYREALSALNEFITQTPRDAASRVNRARVHAALKDKAAAIKDYQGAIGR